MMIYQALMEAIENSHKSALCTVIKTAGSTPRHSGSKMLVYQDGKFVGTVGGGEIEQRVLREALDVIHEGKARLAEYKMVDPSEGDPGVCGGTVWVYVEPVIPPALVLVIGGGHVGKAVVHLAHWLGFRVAISDDRLELCTSKIHPEADDFYPVPMADLAKNVDITPDTYIILATRGANVDIDGLKPLLDTPAAYIGVIGSRRRWLTTRNTLIERGVPVHQLDKVHAPIGLELEAETPEEIAVSIMAEIIMLRNHGSGKQMKITEG